MVPRLVARWDGNMLVEPAVPLGDPVLVYEDVGPGVTPGFDIGEKLVGGVSGTVGGGEDGREAGGYSTLSRKSSVCWTCWITRPTSTPSWVLCSPVLESPS